MKTNKKTKPELDKTAEDSSNPSSNLVEKNSFPIVGIGASAGGLEALELFFKGISGKSGMAFVVIQHLDPNHVGIMPELLQRYTAMEVLQAKDRLKVEPNCVYVIPPNKSLSIFNGALYLFEPVQSHGLRLPIDIFFRSLAEEKRDKSIGVILSGMGSDGSLGLKVIKEKEGIVVVQTPDTAKFDGMPRSALEAVIPDIVAPANEIPSRLVEFLKFIPEPGLIQKKIQSQRSNLDKIIILLREHTSHDFSLYKKNTLLRRIERRKGVHQINNIQGYVRFLQENPGESEILFKELLIGVTNFFRDTAVWEKLKKEILPGIIQNLPEGYVMRAWVTGCSTGEEAYSLAIVFKEVMAKLKIHKNITLQIFATDLDQDAIDKARKGVFPANIVNDVSAERLSSFFNAEAENYYIKNNIREMVVFAPQNVIKDPPFTRLDILSCRNMLIYMESELQKKLISLFNYSLNTNGVLILGTSETLGNDTEGFTDIDAKLKLFKRSEQLKVSELIDFPSSFYRAKTMRTEKEITPPNIENIQTLADQVLLQQFAPASLLVNKEGDILYITGRTGKYLEPAAGKANWNIYAMAREGLRHELPGVFRKALKTYDPIVLPKIKIGSDKHFSFADVTVQRIQSPEKLKGMLIVVFNEVKVLKETEPKIKPTGSARTSKRVKDLELELNRNYEEVQSMREEMQTSQEELKSTNEELQSTNEELQSSNEELTTSKEEMQSLNEELQTVNIELQSKVNDYLRASDDMKNLLNSIEIATLFLDKDLNIRRFTDSLTNIFKLRATDIGRPITDLVNYLNFPEMENSARKVLKTLVSEEFPIETNNGKHYNIRIMPYRTIDDRIDGLVFTFSDVTVAKTLEFELKKVNKNLRKE